MRYEKLLEAVPDALVGVDQNGVIRFVNRQTEVLFGYERDQLIGQSIDTLVSETLWEIYSQHRKDYFADPRTRSSGLDVELSGRHRIGGEFLINVNLSQIETGDVLLVITGVEDVTARQQAVENAGLIEAIVEYSDDAIIGSTLQGMITSWNPAAEELYGYSSREATGRYIGDLLAPKDRAGEPAAVLAKVSAGRHVHHLETERVRKDATVVPVSITVAPVRDAGGAIVGASEMHRDVTGQRQAFESAQALAAIVESSDDAIISRTLQGVIKTWNPAAEVMFGYSREEIVGESIQLLVPEERSAEEEAVMSKVGAGQPVKRLETTRIRKDGTVFPASVTYSPIRDIDATITGVSAICRDVTEQRWALSEAQRLAAIVENSDEAVVSVSLDGTMTSWNPAAEAMFGYSSAQVLGKSAEFFTPSNQGGEIRDVLAQVRAGRHIQSYETKRVRKDATVLPVSLTVSPIRDADGAIAGVSGTYRDITAQRQAFETAQRMAAIVEGSDDAIFGSTLKGTITSWNPAAERLFGYSGQEMIGNSGRLLTPEGRTDEMKTILAKVGAGQHIEHLETVRVRKDGTVFPASLTVSPICDTKGSVVGASAICHDMTEQKRAEQLVEQDRVMLRATMDSLLDPHVLLEAVRDEAGQIVNFAFADANPAACEYARRTHDELIKMRLPDLFQNVAQPGSLVYQCRRVVETGEPLMLDDVVYTQELLGQERHYDVRAARVGDGLSYTWRDVTDRQSAAEWVAESEEHFRLLAENASDVVMRLGADRRFGWVSGSVADVLGWRAEDLLGHVIDEFIHSDDLDQFGQAVAETSSEDTARMELRFRRSDGSYRWVLCHTRLKLDKDGARAALVGGLVDIEARKEVEAQEMDRLATLERFLQLTVGRELKMVELKKEIGRLRSLVHQDGDQDGEEQ